jgi:pyruvate kinase
VGHNLPNLEINNPGQGHAASN